MKTAVRTITLSVLTFLVAGCGGQNRPFSPKADRATSTKTETSQGSPSEPEERVERLNIAMKNPVPQQGGEDGKAKQAAEGDVGRVAVVPRKIIYNAEVKMVVDDLPTAEDSLKQLLKKHDGFIAQSELSGSTGARRSGHWRLRVPVDSFDEFMTELTKLGVPEVNKTDSQDVTDQFYDLEARIKNRKSEEESLRKLLEQTTGKMEDILTVRRELNQVRADIDQKEGQLRRLANLSSLTTVNVTLQEIKDYVPPQAPTFGSNIASTFAGSVEVLESFGKGLVLFVVAVSPWLPLLLLLIVPGWVLLRRRRPVARPTRNTWFYGSAGWVSWRRSRFPIRFCRERKSHADETTQVHCGIRRRSVDRRWFQPALNRRTIPSYRCSVER
jgi:hypothetical protein